MPLIQRSQNNSSALRPSALLNRNKENAKPSSARPIKAPAPSNSTTYRRKRRAEMSNPASRSAARASDVGQSHLRRMARSTRKLRQPPRHRPVHSTAEPMNAEPTGPAATSSSPSSYALPRNFTQVSVSDTPGASTSAAAAPPTYHYPRFLPRYQMKRVSPEALAAINPALIDAPPELIIEDIEDNFRSSILNGLQAVKTDPTWSQKGSIPTKVTLRVNPTEGHTLIPTHVLAVLSRSHRRVELFPIHDLLWAAHCAHLPPLQGSGTEPEIKVHGDGSRSVELPVVLFQVESGRMFHLLWSYLYRRDTAAFLKELIPLEENVIEELIVRTGMEPRRHQMPPPFSANPPAAAPPAEGSAAAPIVIEDPDDDPYAKNEYSEEDEYDSDLEFDELASDVEIKFESESEDENPLASSVPASSPPAPSPAQLRKPSSPSSSPSSAASSSSPSAPHVSSAPQSMPAPSTPSKSQSKPTSDSPSSSSSPSSNPPPPAYTGRTPVQQANYNDMMRISEHFGRTYTRPRLIQQASTIHSIWTDVIALGIADKGVWNIMCYAWSVTVNSLVESMSIQAREAGTTVQELNEQMLRESEARRAAEAAAAAAPASAPK